MYPKTCVAAFSTMPSPAFVPTRPLKPSRTAAFSTVFPTASDTAFSARSSTDSRASVFAARDIAITEEAAAQLDFLLVPNSHTHITNPGGRDDREAHAKYMMRAFYDILESKNARDVTAIARPFLAVACPYPWQELLPLYSDDEFRRAFRAAAECGIAMEFNPSTTAGMGPDEDSMRAHPCFRMFRLMKECGCRFTYGSDRHSAVDYRRHEKTERFAALVGVTEDRILDLK